MVTDTDIVAWMMKGEIQDFKINQGTAIECRVCAEDPRQDFSPSFGIITSIDYPAKSDYFRCDTWIQDNTTIGLKYDSLLSKIMVYGQNRQQALDRMSQVLKEYKFMVV